MQFSKMQTRPLFLLLSYAHSLQANKLVEPALTQARLLSEAFFISFRPPVLTLLWARLHLLSITPLSPLCPAPPPLRLICWSFYFTVSLSQLSCGHFISSLSVCWVFFFFLNHQLLRYWRHPRVSSRWASSIPSASGRDTHAELHHFCQYHPVMVAPLLTSWEELVVFSFHSVFSSSASLQAVLWSDWQTVDVQKILISCLLIYLCTTACAACS